jgi:Ca-activated chloride channel family protein
MRNNRSARILPVALLSILILVAPLLMLEGQTTGPGFEPKSRILFIFDASNSMAGQWEGSRKIDIAREILFEMVDSLEEMRNVEMALRIYGHQSPVPPQDCSDTKLEVPFGPSNAAKIRDKLRDINPKGTTPIARSLELAPNDFPSCSNCRNIILLITDGVEACDGDPCQVSLSLQRKGIILRPFVIGIGTDPGFRETFNCIGEYYDAPSQQKFREALKVVVAQALNPTSAQVNLLDSRNHPTETDLNMIFRDHYSGVIRYNKVHTLNSRGIPDTLSLDPMYTYDLTVQSIPPVTLDSIELTSGRHNIIPVDAPQGYLHVHSKQGRAYEKEKILVKRSGDPGTINIQEMGKIGKYLVGTYDLEIPIYPLMIIEGVEILQSSTTTVEIPAPGYVNFTSAQPGVGTLYQLNRQGEQKWVLNLPENTRSQGYHLQPGMYRIVWRRSDLNSTSYSVVRDFRVEEGSYEVIRF